MKPIIRILSYLKHFPWHLGINVFFNLLHIVFNLGSYVMIVPFVELLFGLGDVPETEPAFSISQEGLTGWAFWHLHQYRDAIGLWKCLVIIAGGYLTFSLLSNLFRYLALFFLDAVRNGLIEHLRNDLYHRIVDTMRVRVRVCDTITVRDSVYLELPREQAYYQDTAYRAWVSSSCRGDCLCCSSWCCQAAYGLSPRLARVLNTTLRLAKTGWGSCLPRWKSRWQGCVPSRPSATRRA